MRAVKSKNTKPEIEVRKCLHSLGFRYRLHSKYLSGKPDLVLKKYNAVIFVNGCFWHGHDCPAFSWPKTRQYFWKEKISGNISRDIRNYKMLKSNGWRIAIIWECALKGKRKLTREDLGNHLESWLRSNEDSIIIKG